MYRQQRKRNSSDEYLIPFRIIIHKVNVSSASGHVMFVIFYQHYEIPYHIFAIHSIFCISSYFFYLRGRTLRLFNCIFSVLV